MKFKSICSSDVEYTKNIKHYTAKDGVIAIGYYIFFMITYYFMGKIYKERQLYIGVPCNLILALVCILIVICRKQKLETIGLTLKNAKKSIILGSILGLIEVIFNNVLPSILSGCNLNGIPTLLYNIFYYFVVIAFVEEIAFRGFIQTRIYGLIKNDIVAVIISAMMFSLMHVPFQMAVANIDGINFILTNVAWLSLLFVWHIVMNFLYRKYNSLFANTIFHGFMDWGNSLFL